jgi:predicted Holliday junction resolvase-like endonuclease
MSDGKVNEILFVDVKTGGAILTKRQKEIQAIINEKKNVKFRTY